MRQPVDTTANTTGTPSYDDAISTDARTTFEQHYTQLVGPKLLNLVTIHAYLIQNGLCSFSEACSIVMRHAWQRGAGHLSPQALDDLHDWISDELLQRIDDPPQDGVLTPRQIERLKRHPVWRTWE